MKNCPKCNSAHEKPGTFCSRSCSAGRVHSPESRAKLSATLKAKKRKLTETEIERMRAGCKAAAARRRSETPFDLFGWDIKKQIVREEQNQKCNRCGLSQWQGERLGLEVDHKNGDRRDNSRDNLEALCPNCHSLTPTWKGRNCRKYTISDDDLLKLLRNEPNINQALLKAGLQPHVRNYNRAKKLMEANALIVQEKDVALVQQR